MLKPYCQSVLRVRVPLVVVLARQQMRIEQVVKLVPGVLIQFDKACDSPMTIEVGDQVIADGEVVKTGDKFGVRIGNILKPSERFVKLDGANPSK
ncbi:MAG: FliM/FliN family flagellar motor C-terminal domain-containing protein [Pirellulaceae bacterium]